MENYTGNIQAESCFFLVLAGFSLRQNPHTHFPCLITLQSYLTAFLLVLGVFFCSLWEAATSPQARLISPAHISPELSHVHLSREQPSCSFSMCFNFFPRGFRSPSETAASLSALKVTFKTDIFAAFNFKGWLSNRKKYFKKGREWKMTMLYLFW